MNNTRNRALCMELLHADEEDEVISILEAHGYWSNPDVWRTYGDRDGNFSTVGNQQSRPEAALAEKLINSVDARLMNACLVSGIDPKSDKAPPSIRRAVAQFFENRQTATERGGTLRDWSSKERTDESRNITLAATGPKKNPCLTIADTGEGQTPNRMPQTFLSIDKDNKLRIPFVQGKFNMGGTGALKFCGHNHFQLVISRRNPAIIATAEENDLSADLWGFTIVWREAPREEAGAIRNSVYKYLAPMPPDENNGKRGVLRFKADSLPLFPEHNRPYEREIKWGSTLKLYNYDMKGFASHILMKNGLLFRLEVLLPEIALPIRLHECRKYAGKSEASFATTLSGLVTRLEEGRGGNLEDGFPKAAPFHVEGENMTAHIYAFQKGKAEVYRTNEGVVFTINGQTHGMIPKTIFARKSVKMHRLADSLLVIVDCDKISVQAREDLFMNSRDRLSNGDLRKAIEREIEDLLESHQALRSLREQRREKEIAGGLENSKPLEDVLTSIFKSSPSLASLFLQGQRLGNPFKRGGGQESGKGGSKPGEEHYNGKLHPTFFKFHGKKQEETLKREAQIGRRCRVRFDTDVVNDYFGRLSMPGRYRAKVVGDEGDTVVLNGNLILHNGYGNWNMKIPDNVSIGDQLKIECLVSDDVNPDGFTNIMTLNIVKHTDSAPGNSKNKRRSRTKGGGKTGDETPLGIELPDIKKVREPDWLNEGFNEFSSTKVTDDVVTEDGEEKTVYTFTINVDNKYLKTDMKNAKSNASLIEAKFVYGNVLLGLALIQEDEKRKSSNQSNGDENGDSEVDLYRRIEDTTRAIAPFLVPMIDSLGALTDEEVESFGEIGDQE